MKAGDYDAAKRLSSVWFINGEAKEDPSTSPLRSESESGPDTKDGEGDDKDGKTESKPADKDGEGDDKDGKTESKPADKDGEGDDKDGERVYPGLDTKGGIKKNPFEDRPTLKADKGTTWSTSTSDPTKLLEVVEVGKQLLMTRGSLTTFSIANDVAKYFAILPAMFSSYLRRHQAARRDAPRDAVLRDPLAAGCSTGNHHHPAHPARAARREVPGRSAQGRAAAPVVAASTASAA